MKLSPGSWYRFSSLYHILRGQKSKRYFKIFSVGAYLTGKPTLRENQKTQVVLHFLKVATHFYPKIQGSNLSTGSHSKTFKLYKGTQLQLFFLASAFWQAGDSRKTPQVRIISISKLWISQTTGPNFFHQGLNQNLHFWS